MRVRCRKCNTKAKPGARFCAKCGSSLSQEIIKLIPTQVMEVSIQDTQSIKPAEQHWHKKNHLKEQLIPAGFQIYERVLEVSGIAYRKEEAVAFIKESFVGTANVWIELEREENNVYDSNAIRVLGCCRGQYGPRHRFLGYVPREYARRIVERGFWGAVQPRLETTFLDNDDFTEIRFQILGPKERWKEYQGYE